jgi:hypothetical protein
MEAKTQREGRIKIELPTSDAAMLMDLVRAKHSSRTRLVRLALAVYKALSDDAASINGHVYVSDGDDRYRVVMPWDSDWEGMPERVEDDMLGNHGDVAAYRASELGGNLYRQREDRDDPSRQHADKETQGS